MGSVQFAPNMHVVCPSNSSSVHLPKYQKILEARWDYVIELLLAICLLSYFIVTKS
jgi:hypothetical protein